MFCVLCQFKCHAIQKCGIRNRTFFEFRETTKIGIFCLSQGLTFGKHFTYIITCMHTMLHIYATIGIRDFGMLKLIWRFHFRLQQISDTARADLITYSLQNWSKVTRKKICGNSQNFLRQICKIFVTF